jgi:hypothetical protein
MYLTVHQNHLNVAKFALFSPSLKSFHTLKGGSASSFGVNWFRGNKECAESSILKTSQHNSALNQDSKDRLFTCADIQDAARRIGMEISLSTLGPFYRTVIRLSIKDEADPKGKIIGVTSGTITSPLLRQDAMKIYGVNTGNQLSRKESLKKYRGWTSPTTFGLSLILGAYGMRYAYDQGCTKAELLAINDNDRQHMILRRHYQRLGLKPVREVTEDLSCIPGKRTHLLSSSLTNCCTARPDRLVWGGVGTLMEADIVEVMARHAAHIGRLGL